MKDISIMFANVFHIQIFHLLIQSCAIHQTIYGDTIVLIDFLKKLSVPRHTCSSFKLQFRVYKWIPFLTQNSSLRGYGNKWALCVYLCFLWLSENITCHIHPTESAALEVKRLKSWYNLNASHILDNSHTVNAFYLM